MNNAVRTVIVIFVIAVMTISIFFIPCKQFTFSYDGDVLFTGARDTYSVFEMYQMNSLDANNRYFYYIDWQILYIELLPLTVLAIGTSLMFKR